MIKVYNTGPIIRNFKGYEINSGVCYLTARLLADLKKDKNMSGLIDNNIIIVEEEKINAYFKVETTLNYLENLDIETLNNIDIESAKFFNKDIETLIENLKIIKTPFLHETFNRLETKINNIKNKLSKAKANTKGGGVTMQQINNLNNQIQLIKNELKSINKKIENNSRGGDRA